MNAIPADILTLFAELGPSTPCIDGVTFFDETHAWAVSLDGDEVALLIEWVGEPASLAFTTTLGQPSPDDRAQVLAALLEYNMFWHDSGGIRTGLSGDSGELLLMREAPAHGLTLDGLRGILLGFAAAARAWRRYVGNPTAHEPAFPMLLEAHALRV
jgi:hypothetical protein